VKKAINPITMNAMNTPVRVVEAFKAPGFSIFWSTAA